MSFTTYREQSRSYASVHCRSDVLLAMQADQKRQKRFFKRNRRVMPNKERLIDIVLVAVWGASIPVLMWLGALSGL